VNSVDHRMQIVIKDAEVNLGEVRGEHRELTVRLPEDHAAWLRGSAANPARSEHEPHYKVILRNTVVLNLQN
jgi:hypothetical protein